jgi:hypothetical protein
MAVERWRDVVAIAGEHRSHALESALVGDPPRHVVWDPCTRVDPMEVT